ncbi:DUF418 domain-containing protein [uncultured Corynebacterium sp.]|uniref:DUF418 domain-containing protein n=1 Tax=uncultured Corynebacterium sp. TaxID=159447 RepID=UPI0025DE0D25|nr:DUF418 domain-containing protein [uncultured Corynebacterium sp.]
MTQPTHRPRMVVPDIARGLALLGICIANMSTAWLAHGTGPAGMFGGIAGDSTADKAAALFSAMFAHDRGLPMFSTLLGFGVGLITMSLWRRTFPLPATRAVIAKRYGLLAAFGLAHGIFLFSGDIMMFYGLCGVLIACLLSLTDKALLRIAYGLLGLVSVAGAAIAALVAWLRDDFAGADPFSAGTTEPAETFLGMLGENLFVMLVQLAGSPLSILMYLPVMLVGFVWARRGVLADVDGHRDTLLAWTGIAAAVVALIGLPWGLCAIGVLPDNLTPVFAALNFTVGILSGPGILAAVALVLNPVQKSVTAGSAMPWWLWPFSALGKRSMSGYVLQSVILLALVFPFTAGIGADFSAAQMLGLAVVTWAITVVLACLMEALGAPGPLEWAHRRLAYGPTRRAELPAKYRMPQAPGTSDAANAPTSSGENPPSPRS